ncbi:transposase [Dactylosporangium sp. CA-139066]|uniref:transposase n=1 Tax=Dactylosporangium sp. CA-139066 TaxID=3239930 RepID=UPI003D8BB341
MPRPSKYPEDFRRDAVALVRSSPDRSLREIGRDLGVNHETLRGWVNAAKRAEHGSVTGSGSRDGEQISAEERAELQRLRKKVAELELEKDILRKAAAYFAKEMGR